MDSESLLAFTTISQTLSMRASRFLPVGESYTTSHSGFRSRLTDLILLVTYYLASETSSVYPFTVVLHPIVVASL